MIGTSLNVLALLLGGTIGLLSRKEPAESTQSALRLLLGVLIVWTGLRICWGSMSGSLLQILGQIGLATLALSLGHATGNLLHLQKGLNRLGRFATGVLSQPSPKRPVRGGDVFLACTIVFAGNPLGVYGAFLEGLGGYSEVLAIKAVMDGLSALAFARMLGWQVLLAGLPVLALQSSVSLLGRLLATDMLPPPVIDSLAATGGLLVFSVSLIVYNQRKVRLADYLPAFLYAGLLAWWLR